MSYVFLTDGQQRKTLAAARSLGIKGVNMMIGENTRWATSLFSKYCTKSLIYPDPRKEPDLFYQFLTEELLKKHTIHSIFPMDDAVMDIVIQNQEELASYCKLLLPDQESYKIASDKGLTTQYAEDLGMDCPKSFYPANLEDVMKLRKSCTDLKAPLIIKPRKSSGSRGIQLVERVEDLGIQYQRIHKQYPNPIIQELIPPGTKHDVCLLYDEKGELRASFVQKQIRHFPVNRGPSTVQESVWRPDLVQKADNIMRSLRWKGIADVEFMNDPRDGADKLMEINPRFWGSLYMSIIAGVDFPWLYYCLLNGENCEEVHKYKLGVRCRWLLPGDLLYVIARKKIARMDPPFCAGKQQGVYDDILSRSDPMPAIGFLLAVLNYLPNREMWKFILKR